MEAHRRRPVYLVVFGMRAEESDHHNARLILHAIAGAVEDGHHCFAVAQPTPDRCLSEMQHPGDATADQPADDAGYPKQQHEEKASKLSGFGVETIIQGGEWHATTDEDGHYCFAVAL